MGVLAMSERERERKVIFEMVRQGQLSIKKAAVQCGVSYRQALRIYKAYLSKGDTGLIHGYRGRPSNRKHPHRTEIIELYRSKYEGFGPTLASEYLAKAGFQIAPETLRRLLLSKGLWHKKRKRSPYRQRRARREQFGELLQIDGSIHDWLGTGEHCCLLNMVDDATGKTLSKLAKGETTRVLFEVMIDWIKHHGIPLAVYVDLKFTYISPKANGLSHFQMACQKLGIRVIKAYSPQAKGRVERNHAVYQDRFVKELALRGIHTLEEANQVLASGFIDELNAKFEKQAINPISAHRPLGKADLHQIFCWEYERKTQSDWTFSFQGQDYQIKKHLGESIKPRMTITVRKHLDNSISAWKEHAQLHCQVIAKRPLIHTQRAFLKKPPKSKGVSPWLTATSFFFKPVKPSKHTYTIRKRPL
jgi:transposase